MFDGSIGEVPPTVLGIQERLNLKACREIETQFRPEVGRSLCLYLRLDGTSLATWPKGAATERIDLHEFTAIRVYGTMDIDGAP